MHRYISESTYIGTGYLEVQKHMHSRGKLAGMGMEANRITLERNPGDIVRGKEKKKEKTQKTQLKKSLAASKRGKGSFRNERFEDPRASSRS